MQNPAKISMIESAFFNFLSDKDEKACFSKITSVLSAFMKNKRFKIQIVKCNSMRKDPFFGMRCFPERTHAEQILRDTVYDDYSLTKLIDRWRTIQGWEIEIDSRVFDRSVINFNPQEITAMLLHEVGHITYSDKPAEGFYRAYKEAYIRSTTEDKAKYKALYKLYLIPLSVACGFRKWNVDETDLREEIFADNSVKKLGYGDHLISAYQKIIRYFGNDGYVTASKENDEIVNSVKFCNQVIVDLEKRKEQLKDELYYIGIRNRGIWIRNVISYLIKELGIVKKDKYDGNIVMEALSFDDYDNKNFMQENALIFTLKGSIALESLIRMHVNKAKDDMIAQEALFRKNKKTSIPSQLDVDTIFVEVDRIQNHADRRFVLDLIYTQEEKITNFLEMTENNPDMTNKYKTKMEAMLRQLSSMRQQVLDKRSFDKQYKVFVKYPVGYEG